MSISFGDMAPTGQGTLAGRYLRQYWQPIYVSDDLPVKRAKPIQVMGERLTLYRGESGKTYAVSSRCAHRNTLLHTGWVRGDNIRCLYHGWAYDGTGQCVQQPAEKQPFCDKVRIDAYPTQEYLGLIFVFLGEGEPPPMRRHEELEACQNARPFITAVENCNWLCRFDNIGDVVHPTFAHPQVAGRRDSDAPEVRVEEKPYGLTAYAIFPDGYEQPTHFNMPNAVRFPAGRSALQSISWLMPIDDEHCRMFGVSEVPQILADASTGLSAVRELGEAILRGEKTIDDILDHPAAVSIQDYVALVGQGPVDSRPGERLGREDTAVIAVRSLWQRELQAFAEGNQAKRW